MPTIQVVIFGLQMFTIRRAQGRLQELEPVVKYFVQQHRVASTWRPGLALIYSEIGRQRDATKIGCASRTEAAAYAVRQGLPEA